MRACGSPANAARSASMARDLPMPASPIIATIWPSPPRARRQRPSINPFSWARPPGGAAGRETAFHQRFPGHAPDRHRAGKSLQLVLAGEFELEQFAQQILRRLADQDRIGRGERLQPCREIWRFAVDGALLRGAGTDDL